MGTGASVLVDLCSLGQNCLSKNNLSDMFREKIRLEVSDPFPCHEVKVDCFSQYSQMSAKHAVEHGILEPDTLLLIGDACDEVYAVSFLLSRISPVFEKAFCGESGQISCAALNTSKDDIKVIIIPPNFELSSIESIVYFSYGSKIRVKVKYLLNMRAAALFFWIGPLYDSLNKILMRTIKNEQYFCWIYHSAHSYKDYEVVRACLAVFHSELDHTKVFKSKHFLCLDYEPDLCVLLQNQELRIDLWDVQVRFSEWAEVESDRFQYLDKINQMISERLSTPQNSVPSVLQLTPFSVVCQKTC